MNASKWLKVALLVECEELAQLLEELAPFHLFTMSGPVSRREAEVPREDFLALYRRYIEGLKRGEVIFEGELRRSFALAMTRSKEHVTLKEVAGERVLVRPRLPIVMLQYHTFIASQEDGKFYSMVAGSESISWGLQFSYPQLFEDPETGKIEKTMDETRYVNSGLFRSVQRWVRSRTQPASFLFQGKLTHVPLRISPPCKAWIHAHPQLKTVEVK